MNRDPAWTPDGKRFLLLQDVASQAPANQPPPGFVVVLNWVDELKRLVPAK
jgi:hypothetical protein